MATNKIAGITSKLEGSLDAAHQTSCVSAIVVGDLCAQELSLIKDGVSERERDPNLSTALDASQDDTDTVQALVERRLNQITETLGLDPNHFKRAHEAARQALDGAHDLILSDQGRQVAEALPEILDPLVRARVVGLMAALADDDEPSAG